MAETELRWDLDDDEDEEVEEAGEPEGEAEDDFDAKTAALGSDLERLTSEAQKIQAEHEDRERTAKARDALNAIRQKLQEAANEFEALTADTTPDEYLMSRAEATIRLLEAEARQIELGMPFVGVTDETLAEMREATEIELEEMKDAPKFSEGSFRAQRAERLEREAMNRAGAIEYEAEAREMAARMGRVNEEAIRDRAVEGWKQEVRQRVNDLRAEDDTPGWKIEAAEAEARGILTEDIDEGELAKRMDALRPVFAAEIRESQLSHFGAQPPRTVPSFLTEYAAWRAKESGRRFNPDLLAAAYLADSTKAEQALFAGEFHGGSK